MSETKRLPLIEEVISDPAASNWLKNTLMAALQRDAVDAANDAALLAALLERRADVLLSACRQAAPQNQNVSQPNTDELRRPISVSSRTVH